ncbi:MAG: LysM peptidoglycan-binding domain-containing protein [Endomicrobiales bacterium]
MIRRLLILCIVCGITCISAMGEVLQEITVKDGDTLWSVATYYLKDPQRWPEILKYNNIPSSDMNVILPGMKLQIPVMLIKEHLRAAHLISMANDVLFRRKTESDWKNAQMDMALYNDDGLRTLAQSKAKVRFASGEILQVDENSLIILKPEKSHEEIDLISGGVRSSKTKILSSSSLIEPRIEPRGKAPDFRTKVKEDKTTLVEVYEGIVDVTAQGKTITVKKGFGTEVKFQSPPSVPRILPPQPNMHTALPGTTAPRPLLISQSSSMKITVPVPGEEPSSETKNEKSDASKVLGQMITKYRIEISTIASFSSVSINEMKSLKTAADVSFKNYQLPDGIYYYRIAYIDDMGFESSFSSPVQFEVDTTPPVLTIAAPHDQQEIDTDFIEFSGTTEPGTDLQANDKTVPVDDTGKFLTALSGNLGKNVIKITARDHAGNVTAKELIVYKVNAKQTVTSQKTPQNDKEKSGSVASAALAILTSVVIVGVIILILH